MDIPGTVATILKLVRDVFTSIETSSLTTAVPFAEL